MRGAEIRRAFALVSAFLISATVHAEAPEFKPTVTDVTVFKDGHALIMARAKAKIEDGWCRTREVPAPLLGAFWAFAADKDSAVDFVRAGTVELKEDRPCLTLDEIIQANTGKQVSIVAQLPGAPPVTYVGALLGVLIHQSKGEALATAPSVQRYADENDDNAVQQSAQSVERETTTLASFVMLQEDKAVRMIRRENVVGLTVADPRTVLPQTHVVREISLHVAGPQGKPAGAEAEVGIIYLQRGIRWIPDYRVELLEGGHARVTLQGTIINEIADLDNVNVRLVVGVPSFIMKDTLSPIALREAAPKLSSYFAPPAAGRSGQFDNRYLSNAVAAQVAAPSDYEPRGGAGPNVPIEGQNEDLYLYHQAGVTLKKGERAVAKLLEVTVPYEDIYKYETPVVPPRALWQNVNSDEVRRLAAALSAVKVMHVLRLTNSGDAPWTTGPATIFKSGDPLAQQVLTYTSAKNSADLEVTVATDLNPKREENEVKREPNSLTIDGHSYTKVSMHGKLTVTSFKEKPARLIAVRKVFGAVTGATEEGKISATNVCEETPFNGEERSAYSWPWWAFLANPISAVTWDTTVPAGKNVTFEYDWYCYQYE